jgi:glycosyltransferase involved in cell wall biosynthesis
MPKVSIIVPNYNHARYLEQRIDSILNQTFEDYELILLDDCSTDNSREIIERYRSHPKVSEIIYNETNSGTSYKQWYKGISYAKGELIWIAESDDWCDNRFLEVLVPHFDDKEVAISFVQSQYVYSEKDIKDHIYTGLYYTYLGKNFISEKMLGGNEITNSSMAIFRKNRYLEVKDDGFKEMKLCGDWLLWIQIIDSNKVVFLNDKLNFYRRHDDTATNKFRVKGLDIIEGLKVLKIGKRICNYEFNKRKLYLEWLEQYNMYKNYFSLWTKILVHYNLLIKEPKIYLFIIYKLMKMNVKSFLRIDHL